MCEFVECVGVFVGGCVAFTLALAQGGETGSRVSPPMGILRPGT